MKCTKCGHQLPDDSEFCQYCGEKLLESTDVEELDVQEDLVSKPEDDVLTEVLVSAFSEGVKAAEHNKGIEDKHSKDSDFGLVPEKPIYAPGISGQEIYLKRLCTEKGEKIKWNRRGSMSAEGVYGLIDIYDIYLLSGDSYKTIYINMYASTTSSVPPKGFKFVNETVISSNSAKKEKKEKIVKPKYCKHCGSLIDNDTKKCSGCGKQYFKGVKLKFNRFVAIIVVLSLVVVVLGGLNVLQFVNRDNSISSKESEIAELERILEMRDDRISSMLTSLNEKKDTIEDLEDDIDDLEWDIILLESEIEFYDEYVVFVSDDGTNRYHMYDCDKMDFSYFWAYNIENAEGMGYDPCPYCH